MTALTVTQYLTGKRIAAQRRHIPAETPTTVLTVEGISFAVLDKPWYDEVTMNTVPANEVVEVTFPSGLSLDLNPGAVRFLDEIFGEGFVLAATSKFQTEPGWEATLPGFELQQQQTKRHVALTAIRYLVEVEKKTGITIGQIAHLTRQPVA